VTTTPETDRRTPDGERLATGFPRDLLALLAAVPPVAGIALATPVDLGAVRVAIGAAFALVAPGYALVAALYPRRPTGEIGEPAQRRPYSPGTYERFALGVGASIALLPVVVVGLGLLSLGLGATAIVGSLSLVTIAFAAIGTARRLALDPVERYRPPSVVGRLAALRRWAGAGGAVDTALSAALIGAVLLAAGAVGYGFAAPTGGQDYVGASLVTESGGEYVASGYPTTLTAGEPTELTLRLRNDGAAATDLTAVAQLQRADTGGDSVTVLQSETVAQVSATVDGGETVYREHEVRPSTAGDEMRLIYYVYEGDAPAEPTVESADRHLHLWVDVETA